MKIEQLVHDVLVRTSGVQSRTPALSGLWRRAHGKAVERWQASEVRTNLHGFSATINFANPYPIAIRRIPNYNAPQVELVAATAKARQRPIHIVDVGAAVGDTALLLLSRCDSSTAHIDCVEGEDEFVRMLTRNVPADRASVHHAMLSDREGPIGGLVRDQHQGTASVAGCQGRMATTIDAMFGGIEVDMIKIDTDGFDGRILAGATRLLQRARPSVLFEWHPILCGNVGTDDKQAFDVLRAAGYDRFVFFTKFGQFSHFGDSGLDDLRKLCLESTTLIDWHYDVAALHGSSTISEVQLADLTYWGRSGW